MKQLVIVDTVGNPALLHQDYKARLPFVRAWHGWRPAGLGGKTFHPHGGMVAEKAALACWRDPEGIDLHFVQVFDQYGDWYFDREFVFNALREIAHAGPTWICNSWGGYSAGGSTPAREADAAPWRAFLEEFQGRVRATWAAGNEGDFDAEDSAQSWPQSLLTDLADKIGAADRDGKPSAYSSDSPLAPPAGVYWSTNVLLLNPVTGRRDKGSGTSFAAPKHAGVLAARGLLTQQDIAPLVRAAVRPAKLPAGVTIPHPKWGFGWLEREYQQLIAGSPYLSDAVAPAAYDAALGRAREEWFDMERVTR